MERRSKKGRNGHNLLHWSRFLVAIFAILVAATHLASSSGSAPSGLPTSARASSTGTIQNASARTQNTGAATRTGAPSGFQYLGLWLDIEIIAYTVIAVVFLFGMRSWYVPAVLFNAFNVGIYFISGAVPIPGITGMAFGNRLGAFSHSFDTSLLIVSWLAVLILGLVLLKYDPGSALDRLYRTHSDE